MNTRERFYKTLHYGKPDRVPYFEEGIREDVIEAWTAQGMLESGKLWEQADEREEIRLDIYPDPSFENWPKQWFFRGLMIFGIFSVYIGCTLGIPTMHIHSRKLLPVK